MVGNCGNLLVCNEHLKMQNSARIRISLARRSSVSKLGYTHDVNTVVVLGEESHCRVENVEHLYDKLLFNTPSFSNPYDSTV